MEKPKFKKIRKIKTEDKLKLSIESLDNFGVYPEIIKDMLNDLNKLVAEKKSERISKEHFRTKMTNCLIELQDRKDIGY